MRDSTEFDGGLVHTDEAPIQPFPGLRPFRSDENFIFFGRDAQVTELLGRLRRHRFVAVLGSSGSGKSSLVRAGLLPALFGGTIAEVGSAWEVAVMRPGGQPLRHLAEALCEADLYAAGEEDIVSHVQATLSRGRHGLVEAARQSSLPKDTNLLLVVDQFEEIFRFGQGSARHLDAAVDFVDLVLDASRDPSQRVYVVLTMRADFLGECAQFPDLVEAVNDGKYLIPRMTREQLRAAIEGPARVAGGSVSPRLVHSLLNDVGDDPDQLPVLQHALMRTWDIWRSEPGESGAVDLPHFEATGGLLEALSRHADEIFDSLRDDRQREVARRVFQALTLRGSDGRGIRRPHTLARLARITGGSEEEVTAVVEAYRRPGVTFLMPGRETALSSETVVDISHESLMRVWRRLQAWVDDESQSTRIYSRLAETAKLWREGKAGLYQDPDLQIARSWLEETKPTRAWARQYGEGFEDALEFLEKSREAATAAAKRREEARQRELETAKELAAFQTKAARTFKVFAGTLAVGLCIAIALSVWALGLWREAELQESIASSARDAAKKSEQRTSALLYDANSGLIQAAFLRDNFPRVETLLDEVRAHPSRGLEWLYWQKRLHDETRTWWGFEANLVAFSPDGRRVAVAGHIGNRSLLAVWDAESGEEIVSSAPLMEQQLERLSFHPDGERVLVGGRFGTSSEYDARTGAPLRQLGASSCVYSPDGTKIVGEEGHEVLVWSAATATEQPLSRFPVAPEGERQFLQSVQDGPDGTTILTTGPNVSLRSLSGEKIREVSRLKPGQFAVTALSPDQKLLALTNPWGGSLRIFDATETDRVIAEGPFSAWTLCFSPDGSTLLLGTLDRAVRLVRIDPETRGLETLRHFDGHLKKVNDVDFSPDGRTIATASSDNSVRLWDLESPPNSRVAFRAPPAEHMMDTVVSPDGRLAVTPSTNRLTLWEISSGEIRREVSLPLRDEARARFSPDGTRLVVLENRGKAWVFDLTNDGKEPTELGTASALAYAPDGRSVVLNEPTPSGTDRLRFFDPETGEETRRLDSDLPGILHLSFSPDGARLAAVGGQGAQVWRLDTGERRAPIPAGAGHHGAQQVAFSPDGERIATVRDSRVDVWSVETQELLSTLSGHGEAPTHVEYSADGTRILTASNDKTARLWDVETGREVLLLDAHSQPVMAARFLPGDRGILTVSWDRTVRIEEFATPEEVARWDREAELGRERNAALRARWLEGRSASAQQAFEQGRDARRDDPGAIQSWLVLGPILVDKYPQTGVDRSQLAGPEAAEEAALRPRAGQSRDTIAGERVWTAVARDDYKLDFESLFTGKEPADPEEFSAAYAVCYVHSDTAREGLRLLVGCDGLSKVIWNGRQVLALHFDEDWHWYPDEVVVRDIELEAGTNVLVFKTMGRSDRWAGSVRIADADGKPVPGLRVTLEPEEER